MGLVWSKVHPWVVGVEGCDGRMIAPLADYHRAGGDADAKREWIAC